MSVVSSNYDPTDLRSQQLTQDEVEARARAAREVEIADMKWLMGTERGRRIVWRWLSESAPVRDIFRSNALEMANLAGKQAFGAKLFNELMNVCPELWLVMMREHTDDGKQRDGNGRKQK